MGKSQKKNKRRIIYDKNYYKAAAMIRDPWFKEIETWLKKRFTEVGCPIPDEPFKKYSEYQDWNKKFWSRFSEMENSPEFKAKKFEITGGKSRILFDEYDRLEQFRNSYLPPIYGEVFRQIMEHFGIDPKDKGFHDFLEFYFFFGQKEYHTSPFGVSLRRSNPESSFELLITIYPHTTKEDLMRHWDWVVREQKFLFKGRAEKNKSWKTFERDLEIYNSYKKFRKPGELRSKKRGGIDTAILSKLSGKWPDLTTGHIRSIISKTRKKLGEI